MITVSWQQGWLTCATTTSAAERTLLIKPLGRTRNTADVSELTRMLAAPDNDPARTPSLPADANNRHHAAHPAGASLPVPAQ